MDESQRIQYEGYRPGMYVRLEIQNVPCEFITNFDPAYPIVVGGVQSGEDQVKFVLKSDSLKPNLRILKVETRLKFLTSPLAPRGEFHP
jgi:ribosome biogenesis protein BMS1